MSNNLTSTADDWYNHGNRVNTMGNQIDNEKDASLRNRLRDYRPRVTRRIERRVIVTQNPNRHQAPAILKTTRSPIKPLDDKKEPISSSRFYLPKQGRSKVLRRRGLNRKLQQETGITQDNPSRLKVILSLFAICLVIVVVVVLVVAWQSHRLIQPQ